jgi:inner membrane transporter RhtA
VARAGVTGSRTVPASVLVVTAIASVQTGAAIAARLFPVAGVGGTLFLRLAISAVVLVALARPRVRPLSRSDRALVFAFGVVLAAMNALFYLALDRIPLGIAVTIEFLGPLVVAVIGSRRPIDLVWVGFALAGVVLLARGGGTLDPAGIALAAGAGACWAGYIVLSQRVGRSLPGLGGLALALTVGALLVTPYGVVSGGSALLRPSVLGKGTAIAVLSSAFPYSLELAALRRMRAAVFGVLMSLEPAMAALSGRLFLHQHLQLREWLAILAVVVASVGATAKARVDEPLEVLA